jgi:hypothetical protein
MYVSCQQATSTVRDCNVRSLVELKFKRLLRKAATRSAETICVIIVEILGAFTPTNAPTISETHAMPNPKMRFWSCAGVSHQTDAKTDPRTQLTG